MAAHAQHDVRVSATIWHPKPFSFRIEPYQPPGEETFWYFYLSSGIAIAAGRHREDLADEIAAMRKLSADAAELARLLEEKAAAGA